MKPTKKLKLSAKPSGGIVDTGRVSDTGGIIDSGGVVAKRPGSRAFMPHSSARSHSSKVASNSNSPDNSTVVDNLVSHESLESLDSTSSSDSSDNLVLSSQINLQALVDEWLVALDISSRSQKTYANALLQFFNWLKSDGVTRPSRQTILIYKQWMDDQGLKPFTRACYLVVVRRFFNWTASLRLYPDVTLGVKGVRRGTKHHHKDALTLEQARSLLTVMDRATVQGSRDYAIIFLLLNTGLRLIEIQRADIADISTENCPAGEALLWIRGKGRAGKDEFVVLTRPVLRAIRQYLDIRAAEHTRLKKLSGKTLFISVSDRNFGLRLTINSLSRLIKNILRSAQLSSARLTAHSLRHTFGVLALKSGVSLYDVQLAMRHTTPATTEIYLGDIEQLKRREAAPERRLQELFGDE